MSKLHSPENPRRKLPFAHLVIPSAAVKELNDKELFEYMLEGLAKKKLYKPGLVFAGFDASEVLVNKGFGDRNTTFAYSEAYVKQIHEGESVDYSPLWHALKREAIPGVVTLDSEKMLGAYSADYGAYGEETLAIRSLKELIKKPYTYDFWKTADGSSLDSAAVALFTLQL